VIVYCRFALRSLCHKWIRPSSCGSKISYLCAVAAFLALTSCGGGGSGSQPPPPPSEVTSVTVSPVTIQIQTGAGQPFTAQVNGTGAFNPSVTWSVNGNSGGNSTYGTIVGGNIRHRRASVQPSRSNVTRACELLRRIPSQQRIGTCRRARLRPGKTNRSLEREEPATSTACAGLVVFTPWLPLNECLRFNANRPRVRCQNRRARQTQ
jgi:hypothetical protein